MSVYLCPLDEDVPLIHLSNHAWHNLLELAEMFGWEPAGCLPCDHDSLCNESKFAWIDVPDVSRDAYHYNNHQQITAPDACCLADALEQSLSEIPDVRTTRLGLPPEMRRQQREAPEGDTDPFGGDWDTDDPNEAQTGETHMRMLREAFLTGALRVVDESEGPKEFFAGAGKGQVQEVIRFCRAGRFYVA